MNLTYSIANLVISIHITMVVSINGGTPKYMVDSEKTYQSDIKVDDSGVPPILQTSISKRSNLPRVPGHGGTLRLFCHDPSSVPLSAALTPMGIPRDMNQNWIHFVYI